MSTEQILERPKTGHGNRARSVSQYQYGQSSYQYERPRTHRSNRPQSRLGRESVNYGRQNSFYGRPTSSQQHLSVSVEQAKIDDLVYASPPTSPNVERPRTRCGRRSSNSALSAEIECEDSYRQYERSERPQTSHGRHCQSKAEHDPAVEEYISFEGIERPRTSRGRYRNSVAEMASDYSDISTPQTFVTAGEVNILSMDDDNNTLPKTSPRFYQSNKTHTTQSNTCTASDTLKFSESHKNHKMSQNKASSMRQSNTKDHTSLNQMMRPASNYGNRQAASQHDPKTKYQTSPRLDRTPVGPPPSPGYGRPSTAKKHLTKSPSSEREFSSELRESSPVIRPGSSASLSRYNVLPGIGSPAPGSVLSELSATHKQMSASPDVKPIRSILKGKLTQSVIENPSKPIVESFGEVQMSDNRVINNLVVESIDDFKNTQNIKLEAYNDEKNCKQETGFKSLTREVSLPPEPKDNEDKLLLAVKLPNGVRVQRNFKPSDQLLCVLHFAETSAELDFSRCHLVCDVPRAVYSDLSISIQDSGLLNRTVLHIQSADTE